MPFTTAGHTLHEPAAPDWTNTCQRPLKHCARPTSLIIDELGSLSYSARHGDLLSERISGRNEERRILVPANKAVL